MLPAVLCENFSYGKIVHMAETHFIKEFLEVFRTVVRTFEDISLADLDAKKQKLDSLRPLSQGALTSLTEKLRVEEVHYSTAIEGNTLTLGETALVLEKGITVEGKPLKDHLEVVGYDEALAFTKSIVTDPATHPLNEDLVRETHRIMFKKMAGLGDEYDHGIGFYRRNQRFIAGSRHVLPSAQKVPELMRAFFEHLDAVATSAHPVRFAAAWHFGFTHIHPFVDGNGRTARLIMNFLLMRTGYPIALIPLAKRARYIAALERASVAHDGRDLLALIAECIAEVFTLYFDAAA